MRKPNLIPTPRQEKLIQIMHENAGKKGNTKTKGEMLREAGYGEYVARTPGVILKSPVIKAGVEGLVEAMDAKRRMALTHITRQKLKKATARENAAIVDTLTKNIQLLTGGETERIEDRITGITYIYPGAKYDKQSK
jgi:hypothetical protein